MRGERSNYGGNGQRGAAQAAQSGALAIGSVVRPVAALVVLLVGLLGCSSPKMTTTDPPAKVRLEKLFDFYQRYTREKKKPPPNEQAFKDFIRSLPQEDKKLAGVDEDVDSFLVSPRDGQKYVIRYGRTVDVGGSTRAIAWEQTGKEGMRFVALSVGYVQETDEETFKSYKK